MYNNRVAKMFMEIKLPLMYSFFSNHLTECV